MDSNNNNDEPSEPFSTLPWHWVMEALAGFKEITTSTLQGNTQSILALIANQSNVTTVYFQFG